MSDEKNRDQENSPTTADADTQNLDQQVDQLLDDVEAMTDEILSEPDQSNQSSPSGPTTPGLEEDPTKKVIADDVGLSEQSPLIQDGERTPAEEVVADVDQELDHMEKLIQEMSKPEETIELEQDGISETAGESPEAGQISAKLDDDIANQIASKPDPVTTVPSAKEQKLDADLDELLAKTTPPEETSTVGDLEDLQTDETSTTSPEEPTEAEKKTKIASETLSEETFESISIWKLIKVKVQAQAKLAKAWLTGSAGDHFVRLLDKLDRPFGKLSPMTKEIIGFCALGTLAMSVIALLIALVF